MKAIFVIHQQIHITNLKTFEELGVVEEIRRAITEMGFEHPMPVQEEVIPYLLEYKFGLKTLPANAIMAIDNILAIFMLPLFGAISDKTETKLGKRTPYILFGTIVAVILLNIISYFVEII